MNHLQKIEIFIMGPKRPHESRKGAYKNAVMYMGTNYRDIKEYFDKRELGKHVVDRNHHFFRYYCKPMPAFYTEYDYKLVIKVSIKGMKEKI